jgi:DNA-binding PadR family transcriptional regulator
MTDEPDTLDLRDKLMQELRRGVLVLAVLSQLDSAQYGYSLQQRLAERDMPIEQGTLYPLLRRLEEQGLLRSEWDVEGSRPRRYYVLSPTGVEVLQSLSDQWRDLVKVMDSLLAASSGEKDDGTD